MRVMVAETKKQLVDHFMVRGLVFIKEQMIDWDIEFDGTDDKCVLFTAYLSRKPVGAARLCKNKIGRVATLSNYRKHGVASEIMRYIEKYARKNDITKLVLHSQYDVKEFYERLGYQVVGGIFQEADIDHVKMVKVIHR